MEENQTLPTSSRAYHGGSAVGDCMVRRWGRTRRPEEKGPPGMVTFDLVNGW